MMSASSLLVDEDVDVPLPHEDDVYVQGSGQDRGQRTEDRIGQDRTADKTG